MKRDALASGWSWMRDRDGGGRVLIPLGTVTSHARLSLDHGLPRSLVELGSGSLGAGYAGVQGLMTGDALDMRGDDTLWMVRRAGHGELDMPIGHMPRPVSSRGLLFIPDRALTAFVWQGMSGNRMGRMEET